MKATIPADEINHPKSNMPTINEAQMKDDINLAVDVFETIDHI